MKTKIVTGLAMMGIIVAVMFAGCSEKSIDPLTKFPGQYLEKSSDEKQVAELIQKEREYTNNGDWKSLYECHSPGYRSVYPYNAFAEDHNKAMASTRVSGGKGKFTVENIDVRIKGDIAYATYIVKLGGDPIWSKTEGDEDIFVRYNSAWYDMTEDGKPEMLGYNGWNEEDAAVLRKAEMTSDEKTVIKAKVMVTESDGKPEIVSVDVSTETVSALQDYQDVSHASGVCMKCIHNPQSMGTFISYLRCVDYIGPGEYELISELKKMPAEGDRIGVIITIEYANERLAKTVKQFRWGDS